MKQKENKVMSPEKLINEKVKIENKIQKITLKRKKIEEKINYLLDNYKSEKRILKLDSKRQKQKMLIYHYNEDLKNIEQGIYKKKNILQQGLFYFKQIENDKQKAIWGVIFLLPWLIGFLVLFFPSFLQTIYWSFFNVTQDSTNIITKFNGIDNYKTLFTSYVANGTTFSTEIYLFFINLLVDLPIIIIFSILIAVLLNKKIKGSLLIKAIFFIPIIYNFAIVSKVMTGEFGKHFKESQHEFLLLEEFLGFLRSFGAGKSFIETIISAVERIFNILNFSGIQILLFIAAIQSIPTHLYETAKIEGATKYEIFWKITIPMITPLIFVASIYTVIDSFARSPIFRFVNKAFSESNYGLASTISVIYLVFNLIVIGIIYLIFSRRLNIYEER